jgi:hypothetical protein
LDDGPKEEREKGTGSTECADCAAAAVP